MKPTVLDASALLAMLFGEPGMEDVRALFHKAAAADRPLLISAVNWAEVLYRVARRQGEAETATTRQLSRNGAVEVVPVDESQADIAAAYKAAGRLGLADAFAAALAREKKAELVTADREFKSVEKEIKISWLPSS